MKRDQSKLEEKSNPSKKLENAYPIFYKQFEKRYKKFLKEWEGSAKIPTLSRDFKIDLFENYCRSIKLEIESSLLYSAIISSVEKNSLPKEESGTINLQLDIFNDAVNRMFKLHDLIIASFKSKGAELQKKLEHYQEDQKRNNLNQGNYLENRKNGNFPKYNKVAKFIKILEDSYKHISGKQKRACEIAGCNSTSFSKWLNSKTKIDKKMLNYNKYSTWQNDITEEERKKLKIEIDNYLEG